MALKVSQQRPMSVEYNRSASPQPVRSPSSKQRVIVATVDHEIRCVWTSSC